jgi:hypothetical protein
MRVGTNQPFPEFIQRSGREAWQTCFTNPAIRNWWRPSPGGAAPECQGYGQNQMASIRLKRRRLDADENSKGRIIARTSALRHT